MNRGVAFDGLLRLSASAGGVLSHHRPAVQAQFAASQEPPQGKLTLNTCLILWGSPKATPDPEVLCTLETTGLMPRASSDPSRRRAIDAMVKFALLASPVGHGLLGAVAFAAEPDIQPVLAQVSSPVRRDGLSGRAVQRAERPRLDAAANLSDPGSARSTKSSACSTRAASSTFASIRRAASRSSAARRAGATGRAGLARVSDQGAQRSRRHRPARCREPAGAAGLPTRDGTGDGAAVGPAGGCRGPLARAGHVRTEADGAAALRSRARIPDRPAVQPRPRPARGADWRDARAGHRRTSDSAIATAMLFDVAPSRDVTLRVRDEHGRPAMASFVDQGHDRPRLSGAIEASRAGLLLSGSDLPRRRRDACGCLRASSRSRAAAVPSTSPRRERSRSIGRQRPRLEFRLRRWIDPPRAGGTRATITSMRPAARTTRVRPKACGRRT